MLDGQTHSRVESTQTLWFDVEWNAIHKPLLVIKYNDYASCTDNFIQVTMVPIYSVCSVWVFDIVAILYHSEWRRQTETHHEPSLLPGTLVFRKRKAKSILRSFLSRIRCSSRIWKFVRNYTKKKKLAEERWSEIWSKCTQWLSCEWNWSRMVVAWDERWGKRVINSNIVSYCELWNMRNSGAWGYLHWRCTW